MSKLRWLEITSFRNVVPGTRIEFSDGMNVLLGKNGTGKTNLLHLISMAIRADFSDARAEPFEIGLKLEDGGGWDLQVRLKNIRLLAPGVGSPGSENQAPGPTFDLSSNAVLRSEELGVLEVAVEEGVAKATLNGTALEGLPRWATRSVLDGVMCAWLEVRDLSNNVGGAPAFFTLTLEPAFRFDERLLAFEAMHGRGESSLSSPPGASLRVTRWPSGEASTAWQDRFLPPVLAMSCLDSAPLPGEAREYECQAGVLMGLEKVVWIPRLEEKSQKEGRVHELYSAFDFGCVTPAGGYLSDEKLSFGEKRLLAFFYYLDANPNFVIADELANGLHYDWIEAALDALGHRQSFLTSQNSLLLDFLPVSSAEEASRLFIRCEHSEERKWRWSNFTEKEGQEFYRDLSVGVEHVSQILRTRGLW
ncbi:MAG: AAA family ATPase [Planctomycetes bacterium]|nr:AAA family ATPase [Planctomycetota bacterium]